MKLVLAVILIFAFCFLASALNSNSGPCNSNAANAAEWSCP